MALHMGHHDHYLQKKFHVVETHLEEICEICASYTRNDDYILHICHLLMLD